MRHDCLHYLSFVSCCDYIRKLLCELLFYPLLPTSLQERTPQRLHIWYCTHQADLFLWRGMCQSAPSRISFSLRMTLLTSSSGILSLQSLIYCRLLAADTSEDIASFLTLSLLLHCIAIMFFCNCSICMACSSCFSLLYLQAC